MQRGFGSTDRAVVQEAAEEAVLRYLKRPAIWNPSRGGLLTFLVAVARKRLLTRLRAEKRREQLEHAFATTQPVSSAPAHDRDTRERLQSAFERIPRTERERQFLRLLLDGERRTAEYARALDITDLAVARQRQEVKRVRDRLLWRLRQVARGGD